MRIVSLSGLYIGLIQWNILLVGICLSFTTACLPDDEQVPTVFHPDEDLVHFDIYVQLRPDSTANLDEQSHQMESVIYYLSRAGYKIQLYKFFQESQTETVQRFGVTDHIGNFKAVNLPPGTYRIVLEELEGHLQEQVVVPVKGKLTTIDFQVYIPL